MIIKSVYINHFGCLKDKKIEFKSGINVISLPNESGKSTIAEFIRVMLYGVNSLRFNQRKKYMPFGCNSMGGEMTVELEDTDYIIKRTFGTRKSDDKVEVINAVSGAKVKEYSVDNAGGAMCGINGDTYENTCYIKQLSAKIDNLKSSEIQSKLMNLCQSSDEDYSYRNAVAILDNAIKDLNGPRGKINRIQSELNGLAVKIGEKNRIRTEYENTKIMLDKLNKTEIRKSNKLFLLSWIPAVFSAVTFTILPNLITGFLTLIFCIIASVLTVKTRKNSLEKLQQAKQTGFYESRLETLEEQYKSIDVSQVDFYRQKLESYNKSLVDLKVAKDALKKAFEQLQMDYSPKINHIARKVLKKITNGKYVDFMADEDYHITLRDENNLLITSEYLSGGTYDQIYFSLRMALIRLIAQDMPVILDDAFAFYDDERLEKAIEYLKTIDNQIIIFSCTVRELPEGC